MSLLPRNRQKKVFLPKSLETYLKFQISRNSTLNCPQSITFPQSHRESQKSLTKLMSLRKSLNIRRTRNLNGRKIHTTHGRRILTMSTQRTPASSTQRIRWILSTLGRRTHGETLDGTTPEIHPGFRFPERRSIHKKARKKGYPQSCQ